MDEDRFNIIYPTHHSLRGAFRTSLPGLSIRLDCGTEYAVRDLSSGGIGFVADPILSAEQGLTLGTVQPLTLCVGGKPYIAQLMGKVVRVTADGIVAMAFENLGRAQELRLDKLVLEIQKRLIAKRKAEDAARMAQGTPAAGGGTDPITI